MNIKCYLKASEIKKDLIKEKLRKKYMLVFAQDRASADIFVIFEEEDGLTEEQENDIDYANTFGIDVRVIDAALIDSVDDPLLLKDALIAKEVAYTNDELEYGLEI